MTAGPRRLRVVMVGWGAIGRAVGGFLAAAGGPARIVAVAVRDMGTARPDLPEGARLISSPDELAGLEADLVVEAAGRGSVEPWARAALGRGLDVLVTSTSAFADAGLLADLVLLAQEEGGQILAPPGALGGMDALAAARNMGIDTVEHRIVKPAAAWRGTEAEALCDLDALGEATAFFTGSAEAAASRFPQNANAALTTALAGIGRERTRVTLVADPAATRNRHEITAAGAFGSLEIRLANSPLPGNPKSSAMTALGIVRAIENRVAPLVI